MSPFEDWAFVALGSNLGDSRSILVRAMDRLEIWSRVAILRSSIIVSQPVDCPPGSPDFLNAVVGLLPLEDETPESLLSKLLALELEFGPRPRNIPNEPRLLDLDLILFGKEVRQTERLSLPHPRAHLRDFVRDPLKEIAPKLVLPEVAKLG